LEKPISGGMQITEAIDLDINREELSEESCPFCGARMERLFQGRELIAERCIQCAYARWME
jgi:hypothetical protein